MPVERISPKLVRIKVFLDGSGQLMQRLNIPGRGEVLNCAEPGRVCEEGAKAFSDLTKRAAILGGTLFEGTQAEWYRYVDMATGSRGQYFNWEERR